MARFEPEAHAPGRTRSAPADAAGHQGTFTRPADTRQATGAEEPLGGAPTNQDPSNLERPRQTLWVPLMLTLVVLVIAVLVAFPPG